MTERLRQRPTVKKKPKPVALIDGETCTGCEVCIEFCPVECIAVVRNPAPEFNHNVCRVIEDLCLGCALCAKECPWECIRMAPRER